MYCYPDIDDAQCAIPTERWLPLARDSRPKLEALLALIKSMFANTKVVHAAVGAACKAATTGTSRVPLLCGVITV